MIQVTTAPPAPAISPPVPAPLAEIMRRVHDDLRRGAAPTFEALLASGDGYGA